MRDSGGSPEGLAFIAAVQRSPEVSGALRDLTAKQAEARALSARYTAEHPAVQRMLTGMTAVSAGLMLATGVRLARSLPLTARALG